eukprot:COSAG01_NODE_1817_length_9164_cov_20.194264_3_plen_392_part_01
MANQCGHCLEGTNSVLTAVWLATQQNSLCVSCVQGAVLSTALVASASHVLKIRADRAIEEDANSKVPKGCQTDFVQSHKYIEPADDTRTYRQPCIIITRFMPPPPDDDSEQPVVREKVLRLIDNPDVSHLSIVSVETGVQKSWLHAFVDDSHKLELELHLQWSNPLVEYALLVIECEREDGGRTNIEIPVVLNVIGSARTDIHNLECEIIERRLPAMTDKHLLLIHNPEPEEVTLLSVTLGSRKLWTTGKEAAHHNSASSSLSGSSSTSEESSDSEDDVATSDTDPKPTTPLVLIKQDDTAWVRSINYQHRQVIRALNPIPVQLELQWTAPTIEYGILLIEYERANKQLVQLNVPIMLSVHKADDEVHKTAAEVIHQTLPMTTAMVPVTIAN